MFTRNTFHPGGVREREERIGWRVEHYIEGPREAVEARATALQEEFNPVGYGTQVITCQPLVGDKVLLTVRRAASCE